MSNKPRKEIIASTVTEDEYVEILNSSNDLGISIDDYVRSRVLGKTVFIPYSKKIAETLCSTQQKINELRKITDANQLSNAISELCLVLLQEKEKIQKELCKRF